MGHGPAPFRISVGPLFPLFEQKVLGCMIAPLFLVGQGKRWWRVSVKVEVGFSRREWGRGGGGEFWTDRWLPVTA
jgi:hypothetical protein